MVYKSVDDCQDGQIIQKYELPQKRKTILPSVVAKRLKSTKQNTS